MNENKKFTRDTCYWAEQCGGQCAHCDDFSPLDESELNLRDYAAVLRENTEEYEDLIGEFEGGESQNE